MSLKQIQIQQFRNLDDIQLSASAGLNVLSGANGAGKTSVLEALAVLGRGRSFRSARLTECIQRGKDHFRLLTQLSLTTPDGAQNQAHLGYERYRNHWRARLAGNELKQLSEIARLIPVAIFEPGTQELVSGAPELRRRYLDWGLFHVEQSFLQTWREHDRLLRQRNAALKKNSAERVVRSIDHVLIPVAEKLHQLRFDHVSALSAEWVKILPQLSPGLEGLTIELRAGWPQDLTLSETLEKNLAQDRANGTTRNGAHRDDLRLKLNGVKAQQLLSRGQQKITALLLILVQLDLWRTQLKNPPIILLDDLNSELDDFHASRALEWIMQSKLQTWVSAIHWPEHFKELVTGVELRMFHVEQGRVAQVL